MFTESPGYWGRAKPDMGGFILNNANPQVMETFSPEQLPVLNGLARHFGISDRWFCSIPGGTDVNRAFSVTGSAFNRLGTWEGGNAYKYWPYAPHRQSIWKTLWSQGITDWKIYNAVLWEECIFTYQLYLKGQIPTVDANPTQFLADLDQFKKDAENGSLPAFSYLEPVWIAPSGATSYHPGADLVPGEKALNEIYEAIKNGPGWEQTLLIITFDKNNGIYDHVAPPYARKPWPNDLNNGFAYDLMGPRVPTIMVSPWIKEQSVFRAEGEVPFDATSFAATLLDWFGVPKSLWGLGDRMEIAPTFETVLQAPEPRTDAPTLTPPYDKSFPRGSNDS
jgi:phospholipase C